MNDVAATRMRAEIRGRESVARWRLQTGTWGARVYAVLLTAPAFAGVLWRGSATISTIIASIVLALLVLAGSFGIARGSRWAAVAVLGLFALDKLLVIFAYGARGVWDGVVVSLILAFTLAQGVWGSYALAGVERDRANVPVRATGTAG